MFGSTVLEDGGVIRQCIAGGDGSQRPCLEVLQWGPISCSLPISWLQMWCRQLLLLSPCLPCHDGLPALNCEPR